MRRRNNRRPGGSRLSRPSACASWARRAFRARLASDTKMVFYARGSKKGPVPMDYETVAADEFGRSLSGLGVNLLSPDVRALASFLDTVFEMSIHRLSDDFAIARHAQSVFQIHADRTFGAHPLLTLVPENPPRGAGAQFYLFGMDPDAAAARADGAGHVVLEPPADKPHGLREATILSPEGYAFSPAIANG